MDDHRAFYEEVGRRIRDVRKRHKPPLTQEGLARLVSLTRTSITNIEKGRQKLLLHTLADIADALHIDPASIFPTNTLPPSAEAAANQLDVFLKHRSKSEKDWIISTVNSSQLGNK